ncbi:GNAT family N-acetyltransferase [Thalassomonas viridans]|uniref:Aminoglycoside N(6')-acetyltransferase type 1 n=1 Tax=Thalassomonas viridans TaxID=137584 RepID=A0AAE9Z4P5_9GAMM|nr:aminoglycoside 6'-N-acetyltransferase [Thalassomonas viridans]WDE06686.1 GNAT family N-acetyltransferase [Thalassomonas viridans]
MKIREATRKDINDWSEMRTKLWPETDDGHLSEINSFFDEESIDIVKVYLAEEENEIVGFLELNIRNFAEGSRNASVPYVEAWYIKPEHQGKGFGKQLMEQAEYWALSLGFTELASDTEIDNALSIKLHKRMGFQETERIVCFLKSLKNT